jgi:hypothetical protein
MIICMYYIFRYKMTESHVEQIQFHTHRLKHFIMEVQKQGNIMTLNELYARDQKQCNEIILVSILIFRTKYNMWIGDRGSNMLLT